MSPVPSIDAIIEDLAEQQKKLALFLAEETDIEMVIRLFSVHGLNAARLGQLLRTREALSGKTADDLEQLVNAARDELGAEWQIPL